MIDHEFSSLAQEVPGHHLLKSGMLLRIQQCIQAAVPGFPPFLEAAAIFLRIEDPAITDSFVPAPEFLLSVL
jgi:hypothetical protein